jgi:hypothetical protein
MPKTRNDAARTVADAFLPLEKQVQLIAAGTSRCIAMMIEERTRAMLPPTAGAKALALTVEAAQHLVLACNAFANAHADLHQLGKALRVSETGWDEESPPNEGALTRQPLRVVREAA